jgi:hypothetical protein
LLLIFVALAGCGGAEATKTTRDYVDQMHFVEEDAVERVVTRRRPPPTVRQQPAGPSKAQIMVGGLSHRCRNDKADVSVSDGRATSGALQQGCELPRKGLGYVRKNRDGWGTDETVAMLQWAFAQVAKMYPRMRPVVVGAISRHGGGRLAKHKSHQSGRDADIGYFASNNAELPHFRPMGPRNLDVEKSWSLIGALLSTGRVQYIFMDYNLQALFFAQLEDRGTDPVTLRRIFQYPGGRGVRRGIIRHARGHRDHFHIRFRCPVSDEGSCIE